MGVKRGIVETITAARLEETNFTPKLSPMKYKKGEKNARIINNLKSFFLILCILFRETVIRNRKMEEMNNRKKTTVMG